MKKVFLSFCVVLLCGEYLCQPPSRCGTDSYEQFRVNSDPLYIFYKRALAVESWNNQNEANENRSSENSSAIDVQVIVHLIGNEVINSIGYTEISNQIRILNEDYGRIPLTNGYGSGVDMKIRFCLASKDEYGNASTGILQVNGSYAQQWDFEAAPNNSNSDYYLKTLSHWNPMKYLNLYVVEDIANSTMGYAAFPWGMLFEPELDGVVISMSYFGVTGDANYGLGRTATHEIGHWLGLLHTFERNPSGTEVEVACANTTPSWNGDRVYDTPPEASPNLFCNTRNSCHTDSPDNNDLIENYMDYSPDGCMNMFTQGQADRVRSGLRDLRYLNSCEEHCNNGVNDGDEIGIDCGGADCPPCGLPFTPGPSCPTIIQTLDNHDADDLWNIFADQKCREVTYLVNGKEVGISTITNVCKENIQLTPYDYLRHQACNWLFSTREAEDFCGQMSDMGKAARKQYTGLTNNKCHCLWLALTITISELNSNLQPVAIYSEEKFFYDSDQSAYAELDNILTIDLNSYLPNGFQFQDGKYYNIEIASRNPRQIWYPWVFSTIVRTFSSQLGMQGQTIDGSQVGNSITLSDCQANVTPPINVVAVNEIKVTGESDLRGGHYFIANINCSNVGQFRMLNNLQLSPDEVTTNSANSDAKSITSNAVGFSIENFKSMQLRCYPNPVDQVLNVEIESKANDFVFIRFEDLSGKELIATRSNLLPGKNTLQVEVDGLAKGLYFMKIMKEKESKSEVVKILVTR